MLQLERAPGRRWVLATANLQQLTCWCDCLSTLLCQLHKLLTQPWYLLTGARDMQRHTALHSLEVQGWC